MTYRESQPKNKAASQNSWKPSKFSPLKRASTREGSYATKRGKNTSKKAANNVDTGDSPPSPPKPRE